MGLVLGLQRRLVRWSWYAAFEADFGVNYEYFDIPGIVRIFGFGSCSNLSLNMRNRSFKVLKDVVLIVGMEMVICQACWDACAGACGS